MMMMMISPKVKVIAQLEFELADYDVVVQLESHLAMETLSHIFYF